MSLFLRVSDLIDARGSATAYDLAHELPDHTMIQIQRAIWNAAHRDLIHLDRRVPMPDGIRGSQGVYAPGPGNNRPIKKPQAPLQRPVASVWELGGRK